MSVPISNVSRRVVLAASGTGPYSFNFEILAATDISVYRDDTLLTLTTNYTVTINTNGTGYVTLTATPTGATQIAIVGDRTIQRTSDFTTGGDLFATTLNDELDSLTIFAQQNAEAVDRALKAPQTDPTSINMTLPRATSRAGKVLSFDSNGNPAAVDYIGENRGNWSAGVAYNQRDIAKDTTNDNIYQVLTAHTASGSLPISTNADSAKWTILVDAAQAYTYATQAAASAAAALVSENNAETAETNAETAETNAETAQAAAEAAKTAAEVAQAAAESALASTLAAYDNFDDRYLGAKSSDPSVDNDGNALIAGALYFNTTIPGMKVYTGSAWVIAYVSGSGFLSSSNNLSDLASAPTALTNLGGTTVGKAVFTAASAAAAQQAMDVEVGVDVQAYDAQLADIAGLTPTDNGVVIGNGTNFVVESGATLKTSLGLTIGTDVQAYDADTAKTDVAQTFTASQRGTVTTDNDGSFDLSVTNNFACTPTGSFTLTFTNMTAGQSGFILLVNGSNYTVSAHANTKVVSGSLTTISATGTYLLSYWTNGTNTYVVNSGALV